MGVRDGDGAGGGDEQLVVVAVAGDGSALGRGGVEILMWRFRRRGCVARDGRIAVVAEICSHLFVSEHLVCAGSW